MEEILRQAEQLEKEYDWLAAVESYEKTLNLLPQDDFLKMGEIQERVGFCLFRAAMQTDAKEDFQRRMQEAVESYKKARDIYQKLGVDQETRVFRTIAIAKYLDHWLASSPSEKRTLLSDCLDFADKALSGFAKSGDIQEYTRTFDALSLYYSASFHRAMYEEDNHVIEKVAEQGIRWGERIITAYSELEESYKATSAYMTMSSCMLLLVWYTITDPRKQEPMYEKVTRYTKKAADVSEKSGDAFLSGCAHFWQGFNASEEESITHYEKALDCAEKVHDMFMKAASLDFLSYATYWKAIETEDPDKRRQLAEDAMGLYDKAQRLYSVFSYMSPRGGLIPPPGGYAEHYLYLSDWETDLNKKPDYLRKAERIGLEAFKIAEESGVPVAVDFMLHILSRISVAKARLERDSDEKRKLLEKALGYTQKCINMYENWKPGALKNIGAMYNELADIKAEIAYLETDPNTERKLLEEAASDKEKCLEQMKAVEKRGIAVPYTSIYGYQDTYWTLLARLFRLTNNPAHMRRVIEVTQKAMETAVKIDMVSLVAESYWKIASAQENLQERLAAADNFQHASESYLKAAKKIPRLERLYQDHASYMFAWSEIEKARHHHARQEYDLAKGHYESAAKIHESLKKWNYLAPNYLAWAQIEQAEDLSGKEQNVQAIESFKQAAEMFKENKKPFQAALGEIENSNEKQMVAGLIHAAEPRNEYCLGRIAVEEAKIQDKKGDHHTSSEKYLSAARTFQQLAQSADSEEERKELRLIAVLSKAWQKMAQAEAEASPRFYIEAAQLFEEAKDLSPNERAKMLALGHSRFCRALEVGTNFADTMETTLHAAAAKHLESAANFYAKAGCQNASEYAKATGFLLDAYLHIDNAKKETDPEKKARLYGITEKVLQAAASSYLRSEHQEKREQVLRLLDNIKDEKELALSLLEVLHAPSIISTTTVFSSPSSLLENAVGLERFENAEIQTNVLARKRELRIGDELDLEIELVNAGKRPALLVKLAEVIPESFELAEKPETCRQEDSYLNMKGRRLDPLKTEEIKLVFKPRAKGVFSFKPRILYLDENGKLKSNEPEPIDITVKELGVRGWLKGER